MDQTEPKRRPIKARETRWAAGLAKALLSRGVRPNQVSIASALCAMLAALGFWAGGQLSSPLFGCVMSIIGAVGIQLRLLCNLLDGMLAVEGGLCSPSGEIYNELPDRLSDAVILIGLGYGLPFAHAPELGWFAALAAVMTAYVRTLGVSAGAPNFFAGPLAKQQRMAVVTLAALLAVPELLIYGSRFSLLGALWIVALGSLYTCVRRAKLVVLHLEAHGS